MIRSWLFHIRSPEVGDFTLLIRDHFYLSALSTSACKSGPQAGLPHDQKMAAATPGLHILIVIYRWRKRPAFEIEETLSKWSLSKFSLYFIGQIYILCPCLNQSLAKEVRTRLLTDLSGHSRLTREKPG